MTIPQLLRAAVIASAVVGATAGCNRQKADETARIAAGEAKVIAARAGDRLADGWITTKIQSQYFADNDIKARYINVDTHAGVVTLSGRVENENAHEQAVQIARATDGVRQLNDRLTVGAAPAVATGTPESSNPAWVTTKIEAKLFAERDVNGRNITVSTDGNGVATLSGQVDTEQQKQLALSIAHNTDGVTRVDDKLMVNTQAVATSGSVDTTTTPSAQLDDAQVINAIQSKFFLDDMVKGRRINVESHQGVVTLHGDVQNDNERAIALLLARTTQGVQRVEDDLHVDASAVATGAIGSSAVSVPPAAARQDDALASKVKQRLGTRGSIEVTSKDGVVMLQGSVPSEPVHRRALSLAQTTDGVVAVVDRLKVSTK